MTESEFETKFDNWDLDCEFAEFLFDKYDASNGHKLETSWLLKGHRVTLKLMMVTEPSTLLQDAYFEGKNPLDSFPKIRGDNK